MTDSMDRALASTFDAGRAAEAQAIGRYILVRSREDASMHAMLVMLAADIAMGRHRQSSSDTVEKGEGA